MTVKKVFSVLCPCCNKEPLWGDLGATVFRTKEEAEHWVRGYKAGQFSGGKKPQDNPIIVESELKWGLNYN